MLSTNDNPQISLLLFECCLLLSQWLAKSTINFDLLGSAQSRSYVGPLEGLGSHQIFPERQNLWVQFGFCAWPSWRKKCYTTTKWNKELRYRNTMAIPFMPILDSTKRFLATSTCTKIQEVVLFNFGLLLGASTNLQPPGFQKILISFGKMGENWIFQIETVNCWKKWRLAGNCCNEGFLRQIPPGCFKTLHKFFYGDSRELTPNHPTVTIHQKPTIPKCISLFTPSKKTRKQLLQSVWKKNMNNKNPSQKKKKKTSSWASNFWSFCWAPRPLPNNTHGQTSVVVKLKPPVLEAKKNLGEKHLLAICEYGWHWFLYMLHVDIHVRDVHVSTW